MTTKGADFSDIQPRNTNGNLDIDFQTLPATAGDAGVDNSVIAAVTQNNVFRLGQQILFWIGIANPVITDGANNNFLTRLRLKPWWARPNSEFRQAFGGQGVPAGAPGATQALPIDRVVFGESDAGGLTDNRYVWTPSPKRLDITPFDTAPPALPALPNSDSVMLDDVWTFDLEPAPTDATYADKFGPSQEVSRWVPILYPAFGYALGFTYEATQADAGSGLFVPVRVSVSWAQGTFGSGRIMESVG